MPLVSALRFGYLCRACGRYTFCLGVFLGDGRRAAGRGGISCSRGQMSIGFGAALRVFVSRERGYVFLSG